MCAIELPRGTITIAGSGDDRTAFLACSHCSTTQDETQVSCIHAMAEGDLAALHKMGVRQIIAQNACTMCRVRQPNDLQSSLHRFNQLIESRGYAGLSVQFLASEEWELGASAALTDIERPENLSRRKLFTKLLPRTDEPGRHSLELNSALTANLPGNNDASIYAFLPVINPAMCDGCNSCCHICPTDALTLVNADPLCSMYKITAENCTGCGMCADVCDLDAVSISFMQPQVLGEVALWSANCQKCGVQFQHPKGLGPIDVFCNICRNSRQKATLFQVLE
jgi:ferredoxin